ncbi:hypothetical protein ZWY2020_052503 [Hordeum vulgare]|nr:hypothetical protein ZWY2020_052503 [Hordeum vulgare]
MTPASSSSTSTTRKAPQQQHPPYRLVCRFELEPTGDDDAGVVDEPLLEPVPTAATSTSCCESDAVVNFFLSCGATTLIAIDVVVFFVLCVMHH